MQYNTNFLSQVIFSISYNEIDILKTSLDHKITQMFEEMTGAKLSVVNSTQVSFRGDKGLVESIQLSQWEFRGTSLQIRVQNNYLQVINLKYTNHKEYHGIILKIYEVFTDFYKTTINRIAFRYVNNISFPTGEAFNFKDLIKPSLYNATLDFSEDGIVRSVGSMIIKDDDVSTTFIYGFVNSEFPNKIVKREFVLDYDASVNPIGEDYRIKDVVEKLRTKVNYFFEKSIEQELRTIMSK